MNKKIINETMCKNVVYLRKRDKLTQKRMAEIMKISISSLRKIERGKVPRCINASTVYRICDYFQISADGFLKLDLEKEENSII